MAAKSKLTDEQWEELKLSSIRGVSDASLADKYGVKVGTIRKRRHDDPVWRAAIGRGKEHVLEKKQMLEKKAEEIAAARLAEIEAIADENDLNIARFAAKRIKSAINDPLAVLIKTPSDLATMDKLIRKASGRDRKQDAVNNNTQVNIYTSIWSGPSALPHDVGVVTVEGER